MARTLHEMAVRLQEYIIDQLSNSFGANRANIQRYNNLKLKMEVREYPHIIITIGISQVVYNLDSGNRVEGGLGVDEKFVKRWLSSSSVIQELKAIYVSFEEKFKEAKAVLDKKDEMEEKKEAEGIAYEIDFKKMEIKEQRKFEREFYKRKDPYQLKREDNQKNNDEDK